MQKGGREDNEDQPALSPTVVKRVPKCRWVCWHACMEKGVMLCPAPISDDTSQTALPTHTHTHIYSQSLTLAPTPRCLNDIPICMRWPHKASIPLPVARPTALAHTSLHSRPVQKRTGVCRRAPTARLTSQFMHAYPACSPLQTTNLPAVKRHHG